MRRMARRYWLLKSDPETFGLADLQRSPGRTTGWDGVRNYQARNLLRDELRVGDGVLFYHSQEQPPAVVGLASVVRAGYPDPTQFDPRSKYHDPDSDPAAPRWYAVDVRLERALERPVTLPELREAPGLETMVLLRKGSRLSVQPVTAGEWAIVQRLAKRRAAPARPRRRVR
jgi:predicted RNA-binding protein with PUA-like domain